MKCHGSKGMYNNINWKKYNSYVTSVTVFGYVLCWVYKKHESFFDLRRAGYKF